MKNLEQIRAKNALEAANNPSYKFNGKNGGDMVKKVPTMILENGILATLAFSTETGKGYEDVFKACITHLEKNVTVEGFLSELTNSDSSNLRAVTSEVMAYLNYLRRFANNGD